jgi:hypothetical protein
MNRRIGSGKPLTHAYIPEYAALVRLRLQFWCKRMVPMLTR